MVHSSGHDPRLLRSTYSVEDYEERRKVILETEVKCPCEWVEKMKMIDRINPVVKRYNQVTKRFHDGTSQLENMILLT